MGDSTILLLILSAVLAGGMGKVSVSRKNVLSVDFLYYRVCCELPHTATFENLIGNFQYLP
jgi:hypothetical protein